MTVRETLSRKVRVLCHVMSRYVTLCQVREERLEADSGTEVSGGSSPDTDTARVTVVEVEANVYTISTQYLHYIYTGG